MIDANKDEIHHVGEEGAETQGVFGIRGIPTASVCAGVCVCVCTYSSAVAIDDSSCAAFI